LHLVQPATSALKHVSQEKWHSNINKIVIIFQDIKFIILPPHREVFFSKYPFLHKKFPYPRPFSLTFEKMNLRVFSQSSKQC
jgi:hypothetical protein